MPAPPLGRFRMLDLSRQLPGPFCSTLLADLGMDVLVVTAPRDPFGLGIPFLARNKRSMTLDLKTDAGTRHLPAARRRRRRAARGIPARRHEASRIRLARRCARAIRGSSTAPSRATARTGRTATRSATTSTISATPACWSTAALPTGPPMIPPVQVADVGGGIADGRGGHPLRAHGARGDRARPAGRHRDARRRRGVERLPPDHPLVLRGQLPQRGKEQLTGHWPCYARLRDARRALRHRRGVRAALLGHALPPLRPRRLHPRPVLGGPTRRDPRASSTPPSARRRWPSGWPSSAARRSASGRC